MNTPRANIPVRCTMVSVVVLRGRGDTTRVLSLRRAGPFLRGAWSYVAGHIEAGERASDCAIRELREETGLVPRELYSADRCETFYLDGTDTVEVVPAFVAFVDDDAEVRIGAEHDAFEWVTFDAAIARVPFGGQRGLFAHVRREFVERVPSPFLRIAV